MINPFSEGLTKYGGDYFSYVLIGYGCFQYFQLALGSMSQVIQREQVTGCLEAMIATQTSPKTSILLSSVYSLLASLGQFILIFVSGIFLFGVRFNNANWFEASIIFILSIFIFLSFGILSAAFIVVLKQGDPISWIITSSNFIFGGAFFFFLQMPNWMQNLSKVLPATYSLEAIRMALLNGADFNMLKKQIFSLIIIACILIPFSLWMFLKAIEKAKKDGTLVHY